VGEYVHEVGTLVSRIRCSELSCKAFKVAAIAEEEAAASSKCDGGSCCSGR
jgi:hypothetical protein